MAVMINEHKVGYVTHFFHPNTLNLSSVSQKANEKERGGEGEKVGHHRVICHVPPPLEQKADEKERGGEGEKVAHHSELYVMPPPLFPLPPKINTLTLLYFLSLPSPHLLRPGNVSVHNMMSQAGNEHIVCLHFIKVCSENFLLDQVIILQLFFLFLLFSSVSCLILYCICKEKLCLGHSLESKV